MIYILFMMFAVNSGGVTYTQEFYTEAACLAARDKVYAESERAKHTGLRSAFCMPKGRT